MEGDFARWHSEDQPAAPSIDTGHVELLSKELSISLGVWAVQDHMRTEDHNDTLPDLRGPLP